MIQTTHKYYLCWVKVFHLIKQMPVFAVLS